MVQPNCPAAVAVAIRAPASDFWWAMKAMIFGAATSWLVRAHPPGSSASTRRMQRLALDAGGGVSRGRGIIGSLRLVKIAAVPHATTRRCRACSSSTPARAHRAWRCDRGSSTGTAQAGNRRNFPLRFEHGSYPALRCRDDQHAKALDVPGVDEPVLLSRMRVCRAACVACWTCRRAGWPRCPCCPYPARGRSDAGHRDTPARTSDRGSRRPAAPCRHGAGGRASRMDHVRFCVWCGMSGSSCVVVDQAVPSAGRGDAGTAAWSRRWQACD